MQDVHADANPGLQYPSFIYNLMQTERRYASGSSQVPRESCYRCLSCFWGRELIPRTSGDACCAFLQARRDGRGLCCFFFGSICHSLLPYMVPAIIWLVGCGLSRLRNDEGLRDED